MTSATITEFTPAVTSGLMLVPSSLATAFCLILLALRFFVERSLSGPIAPRDFLAAFLRWSCPRFEPLTQFTFSVFFATALSLSLHFPDPTDHSLSYIATTTGLFVFLSLGKLVFLLVAWPGQDRGQHCNTGVAHTSHSLIKASEASDHTSTSHTPENPNG